MSSSKITIVQSIQSQQIEAPNKPIVDLEEGDIVELRDDGIYFTRKIDMPYPEANLHSVFDAIKGWNAKPMSSEQPDSHQ